MNHKIPTSDLAWEATNEQQRLIDAKISKIQSYEMDIPGIIVVHNLRNFKISYMSQSGLDMLNTSMEDLNLMGIEFYQNFLSPDSYAYMRQFMELIINSKHDESVSFIQQARPTKNDEYEWYASNTKIFLRDKENVPLLSVSYVIPITGKLFFESKIQRAFDENKFLKKNQHLFASLTKREMEILTLMAQSISSEEIATSKNIAKSTADTHRRNIRKKIGVESPYEIMRFAQAFNMI